MVGLILDGNDDVNSSSKPSREDILASKTWDTSGDYRELLCEPTSNSYRLYNPITEEDIRASLSRAGSIAPGADGVTLALLKKIPTKRLELLFNACLYVQYVLKGNKTILISKPNKDLKKVYSWRPIIISSVVLRALDSIMAARLLEIASPMHKQVFSG